MKSPMPPTPIDLLDGDFYAQGAHAAFRWMRANAPVFWDERNRLWGITRHAHVQEVAKAPQLFCSGGGSRPDSPPIPSMINMDDPMHRRRRALVNKGFTPRRIEEQEQKARAASRRLLEAVAERGACDWVHDVARHLPMIMIGDMLGVAEADHEKLLKWSDDMLLGTNSKATPEARNAAMQAGIAWITYHAQVVADRRAKPPSEDLISALVHAEIDGEKLDDEALRQEALLILVGGDETTRHVLVGGLYELLRDPAQRDALVRDPSRIPAAVEEMLRWVSPIQNMNRTATRDVDFHGAKIKQGDKLLLLYPSANRDEDVFADPYRFEPTRDPNEHLAFGGYGPHFCLGASLARLELRVMFEELLARLPDVALASDAPPVLRRSNFIVGIEALPIRWAPRR
jgi:cytochrome P450 family 142 subfamily A polypeptide 1